MTDISPPESTELLETNTKHKDEILENVRNMIIQFMSASNTSNPLYDFELREKKTHN